ncbi:DUF4153 domain-containing protein [Neorhizobium alkalisoli]|uniref:Uncharacterized protein DUF4173 n=1 Tax=Neorhizobium alkalisoli TaxID=528178 RepID=A0A561Q0Y5_9HYPH|nr:DUF4173 domain-containing protein [Neorhizobium alkalisoli]TWF44041.1 uncharacterized protein DUF4173 [Neorhizobium alkalisoli]
MQLTTAERPVANRSRRHKTRIYLLLAMIAVTDFLIFKQAPGLNLFILSILLTAAVLIAGRKPPRLPYVATCFGISALAAAPLLEAPTLAGFVVSMMVVVLNTLAHARLLPKNPSAVPFALLRFMPAIFLRLPQSCRRYLASRSGRSIFGVTQRSLAGWIFPLGMGVVFLFLFSTANPLIEMGLHNIDLSALRNLLDIGRIAFWLIAAAGIWALMRPCLIRKSKLCISRNAGSESDIDSFLDHSMLVRCLSIFNLLFALQTILDLIYLWGGVTLPAGMSHAEYAHRGAYPLVATALLAAAFVLMSMRRDGPGDRSRRIRILVVAWILQNVLLCLSSILRLDLYIEAYSLTGLRLAAGIWMGLVAAGLVLILLRIMLRRSNQWLIAMNLATLSTVLYLVAFIDFSGFIARFNVENSMRPGHQGEPLDLHYLTSLGASAIPALDLYMANVPANSSEHQMAEYGRLKLVSEFAARSRDWRSWTYRKQRMETYLQSTALIKQ